MRKITIGKGEIVASEVSLGCMRMADLSIRDAAAAINASLESGINFFDHADIYGAGKSEEIFSQAIGMKPSVREKMFLQSKCGINLDPKRFDFSKEHILQSVDGILKRLNTEYLDVLLLHRPDALVEPEEVAEAFTILHSSGKVKHFGVSNQNPMQIELLNRYVNQKLIVNQLQFGIMHTGMIDQSILMNNKFDGAAMRDGSILDYCRLHDITIQAWSPFQYGYFEGVFLGCDKFPELNKAIDEIAKKYGVPNTAIAVAWISRHPARIQTIIGTMNPQRIKDACRSSEIQLTRQEWYDIYMAAGNIMP
ncbi:MAG: aldo/keto reductase [Eubacteriales bacterium]